MTLFERLWAYQAERFPLKKTVPLLAVFSAASINVSAFLGNRSLPGWEAYVLGFLLALILFFQLRAADEWKDRDIDAAYRPERPVPRGLVTLELILAIGGGLAPVAALMAFGHSPMLLGLLVLVYLWLAAMTFEFGVKTWLAARPLIYLVSHMAIMPLIDLLLTGVEWATSDGPAPELWIFLALSLVNGCVLEIGRKTWAPEAERPGVESYSSLWGAGRSVLVWLGFVAISAGLLSYLGAELGLVVPFAAIAALAFAGAVGIAIRFLAAPTLARQEHLDTAAGLWVLVCYGTAGFLPLFWGAT